MHALNADDSGLRHLVSNSTAFDTINPDVLAQLA